MAVSTQARIDKTGLLTLITLLIVCAGFTIGLTFAPCYSSLCVEHFFPYDARIHLAVFYSILAGILIYLTACAAVPPLGRLSSHALSSRPVPLIGKRPTVGGILLAVYLTGIILGSIGYWYPAQQQYWYNRAAPVNFTQNISRIVWTGVTGHWLDILIGLVILPIGRHSVIGRTFKLQGSTLLLAHKILGYALCVGGLIHGLLFYSFLAAWLQKTSDDAILYEFLPDNPTYTWAQAEEVGIYSWFTLPTGALTGIILVPVMVITALPVLRRISYNTFYFLHITFGILVLVMVCLHASTDFYCILPGLLLWVYDISWRLCHSLVFKKEVSVQDAGNGWLRIVLPTSQDDLHLEKAVAAAPPLETYYINIPEIHRFENHAFTAASIEGTASATTLLLRKSPARQKAKKRDGEWTWRLEALVGETDKPYTCAARIEGPYRPFTPGLLSADRLLLLVAGTGISGALSIAQWWAATSETNKHLRLSWTVRTRDMVNVQEVLDLQEMMKRRGNMELVIHVSGEDGRPDLAKEVDSSVRPSERSWIYICGPDGFARDAETACWDRRARLTSSDTTGAGELDWYTASYSV